MIRIEADLQLCAGYANCVIAAPDVYDIDDDGVVQILKTTVEESERDKVAEAVRSCPAAAIWLKEN